MRTAARRAVLVGSTVYLYSMTRKIGGTVMQKAWSMLHGERGERGDAGERIESGEEDEGEAAAGAGKGGGSSIQGAIKKKRPKKRAKGEKSHKQRQVAARLGLAREA